MFDKFQIEKTTTPVFVTAAYTLKPYERTVVADCSGSTNASYAITLPDPSLCAGAIFSFRHAAGTGEMQVTAPDGLAAGETLLAALTLDAAADRCLVYCDGLMYWILVSVQA